jgi:hypothetical protein
VGLTRLLRQQVTQVRAQDLYKDFESLDDAKKVLKKAD